MRQVTIYKTVVGLFLSVFLLSAIGPLVGPVNADESKKIRFYELGIGTGFAFGENDKRENFNTGISDLILEEEDSNVIPFFVHFGWNINRLLGISDNHRGVLQAALEPHANYIVDPEDGVELGMGIFLKYDYPVQDSLRLYLEAGVSPMYYSIDTAQQGDKGFTFLDQVGGGLQWHFAEDQSVNVGYRWRHISNASTREPNKSINTNFILIGYSRYY